MRRAVFAKPRPGELPHYLISDRQLPHGASLGNHKLWVTTKGTGAIEKIFSLDVGTDIAGSLLVTYAVPGDRPLESLQEEGAEPGQCDPRYQLLQQEGPGVVEVHPMRQRRTVQFGVGVRVVETVLLPKAGGTDPAVLFFDIALSNESDGAQSVRVSAYANLQGRTPADLKARYDPELSALVVHNESRREWVRVFGCSVPVHSYETTHDISQAYASGWARGLSGDTSAGSAMLGALQVDLDLAPRETKSLSFMVAFSPAGEEDAGETYLGNRDFAAALRATMDYLRPNLSVAMVATPDPVINEGVFWAKVNMLRVVGHYPQGRAFTNNPGESSNVVARDVVWYTYGCDYFLPDLSREMLTKLADLQYESGKIVEYYNAIDGSREDYGLNINDDTPLFILGVSHHFQATGDRGFLGKLYPAAERAARYLLSQRDERGLVSCSAEGVEVWGICSWRNVIPEYRITGAVTEINSECYGALRAVAAMAGAVGKEREAAEFAREAKALRAAINEHLLNRETGLYLLNIDKRGHSRTDVTADEIFPVVFGVADDATSYRIISRLNAPDFMTSAGLRTVSRLSPEYEPVKKVGLLGGVWPGVTFWYGFAAARYHPEFMAAALHDSYSHYQRDPLANNTVPGQFSEWFHGESLVNHGMRLSPWEPPRLLWAAIEGMCGISGDGEGCSCHPLMPPGWQWIALRRLPHCGRMVSFFAGREEGHIHIYANAPLKTEGELTVYEEDVSHRVQVTDHRTHRVALRTGDELLICVGSSAETTITAPIRIEGLLDDEREYAVEMYNGELGEWQQGASRRGRALRHLAFPLEAGGFRVLRVRGR